MKEPLLRAAAALAYIGIVATIITNAPKLEVTNPLLGIITFLSLFTFSAAVMGYLFLWRPAELLLAREPRAAFVFLSKTLASFAILVALFGGLILLLLL